MTIASAREVIHGETKYHQLAREIFPILVRQAWAENPVTYGQLGDEIGSHHRPLGSALGIIGDAIESLSEELEERIPPIQFLVVNAQLQVPGEGIDRFTDEQYEGVPHWRKLEIVDRLQRRAFTYERWPHVLEHLDLKPQPEHWVTLPDARDLLLDTKAGHGGAGEGEAHKKLKEFIARNPRSVGLSDDYGPGTTEFLFHSGDRIDVLFRGPDWVGVEVKSEEATTSEVARGVFQCIKYRSLLKATAVLHDNHPTTSVKLALGRNIPRPISQLLTTFDLDAVEEITPARDSS